MNWRRLGGAALLLAALSGCARSEVPEAAAPPPEPVSAFTHALGGLGIDLGLPAEGKAIVVNVPAFELIAFEDAEPAFRSRVIVGTPWHRTPLIDTYTTAVRFRPSWRPTPSMVASGEYRDRRWPPGRKNPLGLAAIRLEPGLLVYLHDTNRRQLFEKEKRALSHGCIRVQKWDELSAWLLGIGLDEVHLYANGNRTFDMPTEPVPVLIRYYTSFPDDAGNVETFDNVYGRTIPTGQDAGTAKKAAKGSQATCGPLPDPEE